MHHRDNKAVPYSSTAYRSLKYTLFFFVVWWSICVVSRISKGESPLKSFFLLLSSLLMVKNVIRNEKIAIEVKKNERKPNTNPAVEISEIKAPGKN